jgi:hypothetical protein
VKCAKCGASHPSVYNAQPCLICGSTIRPSRRHRKKARRGAPGRPQIDPRRGSVQAPASHPAQDKLRTSGPHGRGASDYEWHVERAAKGMAERDTHPMPTFVTTPEAFYKVMAGAALEAIDLRAILDRLTSEDR